MKANFCDVYVSYVESVQHGSIESIQETNHPSIRGNENQFAIVAELESGPVAHTTELYLKVSKGPLYTERWEGLLMQYLTV